MDLILRESKPSDETQLHQMLDTYPMNTAGMKIIYDRRPQFTELLRYQADSFKTLVAEMGENIIGFVSFSWGKRLLKGVPIHAVYIGDFRIKLHRKASVRWRNFYPELIKSFMTDQQYGPARLIHTAILKENVAALHSLVKKKKNQAFYYHFLKQLTMVNVVAQIPTFLLRKTNLLSKGLVPSEKILESELRSFLVEANEKLYLGYDFSYAPGNEWDRRKRRWPDYSHENFLLIKDQGKIIASCLPWSPTHGKRLLVTKLNFSMKLLCGMLNFWGTKVPLAHQPIDILYLTHLHFDSRLNRQSRAECIATFLEALHSNGMRANYHMVSFADGDELRKERALKKFVTQETEVEIYAVSTNSEPEVIEGSADMNFEMALV